MDNLSPVATTLFLKKVPKVLVFFMLPTASSFKIFINVYFSVC